MQSVCNSHRAELTFKSGRTMSDILVAATATPGHVLPMLTIARHLMGEGHRLFVLTGELFREQVMQTGATFIPFDSRVDFDYRNLEQHFPDRGELAPGNEQMALAFREYFAGSISVLDKQLRSLIAGVSPSVLLAENGFFGLLPLLTGLDERPPVICMGVTPLSFSSRDSIFYGPRIPPAVLPDDCLRAQLVDDDTQHMIAGVQDSFNAALVADGYRELAEPFTDAMIVRPDRFLQLSTRAFEYPREELPESVGFIGPIPGLQPSVKGAPRLFDDHDDRPLVVVTQGTLANVDLAQLLAPSLEALAEEPVRVVIATGGRPWARSSPALPANARLIAFPDFSYWLRRAAVLVSNGGYGSIQLALSSGVPVIVAGTGEDKKETATRVVWSGCGIDLRTSYPTGQQIRDAVRRILADPAYRQRAAMVSADFARHNALAEISRQVAMLAA
jgi:MGT family glycosyltransferase